MNEDHRTGKVYISFAMSFWPTSLCFLRRVPPRPELLFLWNIVDILRGSCKYKWNMWTAMWHFFGNIHAWKHLNRKVNQKQNDDILDCFFSPESRQTWYCPGWRCHSCWSLHYWKYSISWVFDTICFSNLKKWQPAFSKAVAFGWHGRTLQ